MKRHLAAFGLLGLLGSVVQAATYPGATVRVTNRAGSGIIVEVDDTGDGTVDRVLLVQTETRVRAFSGPARVEVLGTILKVTPTSPEGGRGWTASMEKKVSVEGPRIAKVVGITELTGDVVRAPEKIRALTLAEAQAIQEEERRALAALGARLAESPDPDHQALARTFAEFDDPPQTDCPGAGPGPCIPPPPPDDPGGPGGWAWSQCSRSCTHGACAAICDWPLQAICACTPGTGVPACSCVTNYPTP